MRRPQGGVQVRARSAKRGPGRPPSGSTLCRGALREDVLD
jgi:hypothetical protein